MIIDRLLAATTMNDGATQSGLSRRTLLKASLAGGGGLLLSLQLPGLGAHAAAPPAGFVPHAFIWVPPGGEGTLTMPYVEVGPGTYTSIPALIAEELEVG